MLNDLIGKFSRVYLRRIVNSQSHFCDLRVCWTFTTPKRLPGLLSRASASLLPLDCWLRRNFNPPSAPHPFLPFDRASRSRRLNFWDFAPATIPDPFQDNNITSDTSSEVAHRPRTLTTASTLQRHPPRGHRLSSDKFAFKVYARDILNDEVKTFTRRA